MVRCSVRRSLRQRTGPIAYRAKTAGGNHQFVWFDRSGKVMLRIGEPIENLLSPAISPDGRRVAVHRGGRSLGIWILDLERGVLSLLNSGGFHPVWSPDGNLIAFADTRNGSADIFVQPLLSGARPRQLTSLTLGSNMKSRWPTDWSADGRLILSTVELPKGRDIWAFSVKPDSSPFRLSKRASMRKMDSSRGMENGSLMNPTSPGVSKSTRRHFPGPGLVSSYQKMGERFPDGVATARNCSISTLKEN